jgi:antirestriction protein ArdC
MITLTDLTERIDRSLETLSQDLARGRSETLVAYLKAMARFHRYSVSNVLLIYSQRPDARQVAGFHTWKKLGRHVKRGEKSIAIVAPVARHLKTSEPGEGDAEGRVIVSGFKAAHVFDIAQTAGEPVPEAPTVRGDPGPFVERLKEHTRSLGIELRTEHLPRDISGASCGGAIVLSPDLSPAEEFSTLVHELAHEMLHLKERRGQTTRTVRETEAEAVAFVVSTAVGLEVGTASSDYIQSYRGTPDTLAESLGLIQRAAASILAGIAPHAV